MQKFINFDIDSTFDDFVLIENAIHKGDTLTFKIRVFNKGVLADLTNQIVDFILLKSDGTNVEGVQKSISNGIITVTCNEQATLSLGIVRGTLQITDNVNASHISTNEFTYVVLPSIADTVLEKSKDQIQTLQDLITVIANDTNTINQYKTIINQVAGTTEAVTALATIESYINSHLSDLQTANAQAVTNIANETTQNTQATQNISDLTSKNNTATQNISGLNTENATASSNISALDIKNTSATQNISDLGTQNTNATSNISALNTQNTSSTTNITNLQAQNTRAETNITALEGFGDATTLLQDTTDLKNEIQIARNGEVDLGTRLDKVDMSLSDIIVLHATGINDTTNWNNAINSLANGGVLELTHGIYYIDGGILKSNITIKARGLVTIKSDSVIISSDSGSGDINNNIHDIKIFDIRFEAITKTFSEFIHLVSLNGFSNIMFNNCQFVGFRGDGIYFGCGTTGAERHNKNIIIDNCLFDGVSKTNRNGISVTDGDGVIIVNNIFMNCTKSGMPGAIDFEPNLYNFPIIKNIQIVNNKFTNLGGDSALIIHGFSVMDNWIQNIDIRNNIFDSSTGESISIISTKTIDATAPLMNINIEKNQILQGAMRIHNVKGINVNKNVINVLRLGNENDNSVILEDVNVIGNVFDHSRNNIYCMTICTVNRLMIDNNTFKNPQSTITYFILNYGNSVTTVSNNITIQNNKFFKGDSTTITYSILVQNHTSNINSNRFVNNYFDVTTMPMNFPYMTDYTYTYDDTTLPDSIPVGITMSLIYSGNTTLPDTGLYQGVLKSTKVDKTHRGFISQVYYPCSNTGYTDCFYLRKAVNGSNTWYGWKKVTGV